MSKLKTIWEYTSSLFTTGAFSESSNKAGQEVISKIPTDRDVVVVEFGTGHGIITEKILNRISKNSVLYTFEIKKEFCDYVADKYKDPRLRIINDGAENFSKHTPKEIHAVIGTIPFSFFPKEKAQQILQDSYDHLVNGGYYSQILYTKFNFKKFEKVFDHNKIKRHFYIPIEYIYHCQKKKG